MAELHQPDVVVIDLVMEGSDGLSTARGAARRRPRPSGAGDVQPVRPRRGAGGGAARRVVPREGRGRRGARAPHRRRRLRRPPALTWQHRGMDLDALREEYERDGLDVGDVDPDPIVQVRRWLDEWAAVAPERAGRRGARHRRRRRPAVGAHRAAARLRRARAAPSSRATRAARAATSPPTRTARIVCSWVPLLRQVNLRGPVAKVARAESEAYFAGRPRGSQLAAWASHQSSVLADRAELEARFAEAERRASATARCRARRTGAATGWSPTRSSCGRAGPAGCTTGSATSGTADRHRLADRPAQPVARVQRTSVRAAAARAADERHAGAGSGSSGGEVGPHGHGARPGARRQLELDAAVAGRFTGLRRCTPRSSARDAVEVVDHLVAGQRVAQVAREVGRRGARCRPPSSSEVHRPSRP